MKHNLDDYELVPVGGIVKTGAIAISIYKNGQGIPLDDSIGEKVKESWVYTIYNPKPVPPVGRW